MNNRLEEIRKTIEDLKDDQKYLVVVFSEASLTVVKNNISNMELIGLLESLKTKHFVMKEEESKQT